MQSFDAIVIGGSYAGLSAAMQLARARRQVCVVDAGRPRNRFASASHGFFGQDGAEPAAMIARARRQLLAYPTVTFIEGTASAARRDGARFVVSLESGQELTAARLVLADGVEDELPDLPGLAERWGASVLHCPYCHGYEFGGRRLGVLHSVPGSLHQALLISDWGPTTYFLNGAEMPGADDVRKLNARGIRLEPEPVVALEGNAPALAGVRLARGRCIALDALFIAPATRPRLLASQLGCEFDEGPTGPYIRTDDVGLTSVPGVYAAGDAALAANATLACAAGVMAGAAAHQSLVFADLA